MYTLLVNEKNEIITTVKERIMQRSKLVDNLHILVEPMYKEHDMSAFTVMLEYLSPISREYHNEILVQSEELYKSMLEFKLPFDTCLTKEAGKIEIQLTFVKLEMNTEGQTVQRVRKAGPANITIVPMAAWSNVIADSALTAIDQRLIMAEAMIGAAQDTLAVIESTKADNIVYDTEVRTLQLTSNGQPIGDKVSLAGLGAGITYIQIDENNNLVVEYADGRQEIVGQVNAESCTGIYIPSHSEDGMLTFTLSDTAGEDKYIFDIDRTNNWTEITAPEQSTSYLWEQI